jgi:hypothetical protein
MRGGIGDGCSLGLFGVSCAVQWVVCRLEKWESCVAWNSLSLYFNSLFEFLSLVVRVDFVFSVLGVCFWRLWMGKGMGWKLWGTWARVYKVNARRAVL